MIWLSAIRSGYEFPRRYGPLTIHRAFIVTAAAAPLAVVSYLISDARHIPYLVAVGPGGGQPCYDRFVFEPVNCGQGTERRLHGLGCYQGSGCGAGYYQLHLAWHGHR